MQIEKRKLLIIPIIIIIIIIIIYIKKSNNNNNYQQLSFDNIISENNSQILNTTNILIDETIKIHIIGQVNNPGLVELKVGSRIYDAIELAGGLTTNADISKTNLAYILSDGEKIYIPSYDDEDIIENSNLNSNDKININTANASELQEIPGVGESTANSIIEYRSKNRKIFYNWRY